MGAVTTLPGMLDALVAALKLRADLSGVAVYSGPVDDLSTGQEAIVFCVEPVSTEYEYPTMAQIEKWETYSVEGRVWVVKPGAGETVIKTARDRAFAILDDVDEYLSGLNDTAATVAALTVDKAKIGTVTLEQYAGDGYRDCRLAFTVEVEAHFTPA